LAKAFLHLCSWSAAGLDPDQARPHLLEERHKIPALQLPTVNNVASRISAMNLKDRLRKDRS
jgi:hypothetical protein